METKFFVTLDTNKITITKCKVIEESETHFKLFDYVFMKQINCQKYEAFNTLASACHYIMYNLKEQI